MASLIDPSGRGPSVRSLALRGFVYLSVIAVVTTVLVLQSQGAFRDDVRATAVVSDVGDGLPAGSDVKVRGVQVGSVGAVESTPGGARHVVHLNLKPEHVSGIPASVKARILPTNVFGAPYVELVPEPNDTRPLAADAVVPGDDSTEALQLQTAMTKVRDVLAAVEPAKLNTALTGIAQALDGRGGQLGTLIGRLDKYLSAITPHTGTFTHDLSTLATALEGLQANAPKLLDTVDSALVTSRTIVEKQQQLARTLAGGASTVDSVRGVLDDNADRMIKVIHEITPVVKTLGQHAADIPLSFEALGKGVKAFGEAFEGPHHWLNIDLVFTVTPFTPYNSTNCPRYPGLDGPNCDDPPPPQPAPIPLPPSQPAQAPQLAPAPVTTPPPATTQQAPGGLVGPVGSPQETEAIGSIFGDAAKSFGSLGNLLLGPFLRGATVMPRG
ncbi:MCE family protein [Amycolatopsis anabasis]|uniref:MCE family protein n=1 Tax=Amycolatopsis anabasis TaxID=1840409 RepID=UPI00131DBC58|nr:MlaD family protein [Amycolatopsis anabasis]